MPSPGTPVLRDGVEVGTLRFGEFGLAIALLRLDAMQAGALSSGDAILTPHPPSWMRATLSASAPAQ